MNNFISQQFDKLLLVFLLLILFPMAFWFFVHGNAKGSEWIVGLIGGIVGSLITLVVSKVSEEKK